MRHKQFLFSHSFSPEETLHPDFPREVVATFMAIRPFFDHMSDVLAHDANGVPLRG